MMMSKRIDVDTIYKYCRDNDIGMLSAFNADFWEVYRNNYEYFDRLFWRTYKHFVPFSLIESEDEEELATEWVYDVLAFLMANEKRYSELWRLQGISDVDYNILDNYNVRETHSTTATGSVADSIGAKTETKSGSMAYGSTTETDANTYNHGARSESDSETLGYDDVTRTIRGTEDLGSQENTSENKVSAFNENSYSPKEYNESNLGTRHDSSETYDITDSREDTKSSSHSEASYSDTESKSKTIGSHTDTESASIQHSAQNNTRATSDSENKTINKSGNLGIYSKSKLLSEHAELWTAFNFYKLIFDEIADEFLRIIYH